MPEMWRRSCHREEKLEDGWSPRQSWKEGGADNRAFRLPQLQESLQGCPRQAKDLERRRCQGRWEGKDEFEP